MLKNKISKEEFDKLHKLIQAEYKGDGEDYNLDVSGLEDVTELKSARDHEKKQSKEFRTKLTKAEADLETITTERDNLLKGTVPKDNVTALETSYKDKLKKLEDTLKSENQILTTQLQKHLVDNVAKDLATKISKSPTILLPHIKGRIVAEKNDAGEFVTKIVDKDGKPSALSIPDLEKEFLDNKEFAAIITASKGSGGGAAGASGGGGAGSRRDGTKPEMKGPPSAIVADMKARGVTLLDLPQE